MPFELSVDLTTLAILAVVAFIAGFIDAIAAGKKASVAVEGFLMPETAISRVSTLRVKVGPVPKEQTVTNNSATYQFLLQLQ